MQLRNRLFISLVAGGLALGLGHPAAATNSKAELEMVLETLLAWWPGEYTARPQIEMERALGVPPSGEHEDWYRVFSMIDAPQLGERVIYGEMRSGGKDGPLVPGTQVVYSASIDEAHHVVHVSGRRIKDPHRFVSVHLDKEKQKQLEFHPDYGGGCDFRWWLHAQQLVGKLANNDADFVDGTCTTTSKVSGTTITFDAEWVMNPDEIWIYDNHYLPDGSMFLGRIDKTHYRLYKMRPAECSVSLGERKLPPQKTHDRGGELSFEIAGEPARQMRLQLVRAPWPRSSGPGIPDNVRLALFEGDAKAPITESFAAATAGQIELSFPGGSATCSWEPQ